MAQQTQRTQQKPQATKQAPAQEKPGTAVAERKEGALATVPDYIKRGGARGNENVELSDIVIPRLEVAQALSKCLKTSDPLYIEAAKQGDIYNTVTREVYGAAVRVVPILFRKEYLAWRKQSLGGGFAGAYPSIAECEARIQQEEKPDEWEATETAQQLVLVVKSDGSCEEAVVSMNKTKLKVSKQWNSLIRLNGNDRFSRTYILHSVEETNSKNQTYQNYGVENLSYPPADVYKRAEALYLAITTGARKFTVDTSDQDGSDGAHDQGSGEY